MGLLGYALIHENLVKKYGSKNIPERQLGLSIETMPGVSFPAGTTLEDITNKLISFGHLSRVSRKGKVSYYLNY